MSRKERRAAAATGRQNNSAGTLAQAVQQHAQAIQHYERGELFAAESCCRSVLSREPKHIGCLNLLGAIAQRTGRFEDAVSCFQNIVSLKPDNGLAHHDLGTALVALGRIAEAIVAFERSLSASAAGSAPTPDRAITALNLGYLYEQAGKPDQAVAYYRKAVTARPDFAEAYNNLGALLLAQGKREEASAAFAQALSVAPELFASFADVKAILLRVLPGLSEAMQQVEAVWPSQLQSGEMLELLQASGITSDPLFLFVLESTVVADTTFERFLTNLRSTLLDRVTRELEKGDQELRQLACSLARQCFVNEYIFSETANELENVAGLRNTLEKALETDGDVPPVMAAVVASYLPLNSVSDPQRWLQRQWPEVLDRVVAQQIREVQEERQLRDTIPRLTSINAAISKRVREQYEENPYPRWVLASSRRSSTSINQFLKRQFPAESFRPIDDSGGLDILVAGCGTGDHSIKLASQFSGARLLAIDLSLSSLSYAVRKTRELGVGNVEYAQADILELASLGRTFDFVDSSGVLHHLAEPLVGWQKLDELVRPGGLMRIGVYSEVGRADVVAARRYISERNFQPTAADIRLVRQELLDTPMAGLARGQDFYSTSECRDLLFHVQEQRLDLEQIKQFLMSRNLHFIGFELSALISQAYRARFPDDGAMTDLDRWKTFESEQPVTFSGMYQFWCQKDATGAHQS